VNDLKIPKKSQCFNGPQNNPPEGYYGETSSCQTGATQSVWGGCPKTQTIPMEFSGVSANFHACSNMEDVKIAIYVFIASSSNVLSASCFSLIAHSLIQDVSGDAQTHFGSCIPKHA
jgi:hypothetical protein